MIVSKWECSMKRDKKSDDQLIFNVNEHIFNAIHISNEMSWWHCEFDESVALRPHHLKSDAQLIFNTDEHICNTIHIFNAMS